MGGVEVFSFDIDVHRFRFDGSRLEDTPIVQPLRSAIFSAFFRTASTTSRSATLQEIETGVLDKRVCKPLIVRPPR